MEEFLNKIDKDKIKFFSTYLNKLSPLEFISLGCIVSIILSQTIDANEQNTLGNFLEMVGQILLTSYAQYTVTDPRYISFTLCQADKLQKQIDLIIDYLKTTKGYYDHNS